MGRAGVRGLAVTEERTGLGVVLRIEGAWKGAMEYLSRSSRVWWGGGDGAHA